MVQEVPNAGRDIGPLLTEFGRTLVESYDVVGHIHVKKVVTWTTVALSRPGAAFCSKIFWAEAMAAE